VVRRATPVGVSLIGLRSLLPRARVVGHRNVTGLQELSRVSVRSADGRKLPLQADGDFLGDVDEVRYSILPSALNVVS
jgi:diacylglycerol kinase family enzyme